jgi:Chaperonin GroEL (HSP60 family)
MNWSVVSDLYLLYRDMFCAGRVPEEDLRRTMKACGGSVMATAHDISDSVLGSCDYFEEKQVGGERYSIVNHVCSGYW